MASKVVVPSEQVKNGLLPTPPMPKGLPKANLTDNARQVLMKRYVRRGDDGKPVVEDRPEGLGDVPVDLSEGDDLLLLAENLSQNAHIAVARTGAQPRVHDAIHVRVP